MKKVAIFYFSHSGNTKTLAEKIKKLTQAELFEVIPAKTYPSSYMDSVEQAKQEVMKNARPELASIIPDVSSFDLIIFGYPNWWDTFPKPIASLIDGLDLKGKEVAAFCTHEGSRLGTSIQDLSKQCKGSTVLESIAIRNSNIHNCDKDLDAWVHTILID